MANKITGTTDATGAISSTNNSNRAVLVVGAPGTTPGATADTLFQIIGTSDAATKFGVGAPAISVVKTLIAGGVSRIYGVMLGATPTPYASEADAYAGALAISLSNADIRCIVLDDYTAANTAKVVAHLAAAEAEDLRRYFVTGVASASDNAALALISTALNDPRVFMAAPNLVDENGTTVDGIITAAALAALIMTNTNDPSLPMNGVVFNGFIGTERKLLSADKTALVNAGIVPIYTDDSNNPAVWRLVTTKTKTGASTDLTYQEGTTIMTADDVLESVMARLKANYKRTKNITRVLNSIRTDVIDVLDAKLTLERIKAYDQKYVSVIQDPDNQYGALVEYTYTIVTPLYDIKITQHLSI